MEHVSYTIYFNAVATAHGGHLLAFGWVAGTGCVPKLKPDGNTSNFIFSVEEAPGDDQPSGETPFAMAARIPGSPRSVTVTADDGRRALVHVNTLKDDDIVLEPGVNETGKWKPLQETTA